MKLHRKLKHNEVCQAQKLGFYVQGQGHSQGSEAKSSFCNNLKITEANFVNFTHRLIIIRRYVIHIIYIPELMSRSQFRVRGQIRSLQLL